ncbi:MAG TPA: MDR family oxidoreductase [Aliidongia sp.]|uniref:acrylyl-CoA reductase (NADPH) n=1 Tax=Aliidongia sp. TaxID=1914230 RepID=UPI002DDD0149|nr:MDR family oxidoreductase [Aliidongia sp.]HEV2676003.1 MDR family oxidoreductase [Aliidongia sp.]
MTGFKALLLREQDRKVSSAIETLDTDQLSDGEVLVRISHSTLNYKDGMVLNGLGRLVRTYPHVPGVDFAGVVETSSSPDWRAGDPVILTGWRVGEWHWGGYAQYARVKAEWLVRLPEGMTAARAMAIGTAGFTSMLAVMALERQGLKPGDGDVLVTGAAGGVGSVAVALLARLGHRVIAATGRPETHDYLTGLGAAGFVDRAELAQPVTRPLQAERWAGAIDSVGSTTLATLLTQLKSRASAAACGLAGGNDLPASVIPFLLRGVNLLGIDSVLSPLPERQIAWRRLAAELDPALIDGMIETIGLDQLPEYAHRILKGQVRGRIVVDVNA